MNNTSLSLHRLQIAATNINNTPLSLHRLQNWSYKHKQFPAEPPQASNWCHLQIWACAGADSKHLPKLSGVLPSSPIQPLLPPPPEPCIGIIFLHQCHWATHEVQVPQELEGFTTSIGSYKVPNALDVVSAWRHPCSSLGNWLCKILLVCRLHLEDVSNCHCNLQFIWRFDNGMITLDGVVDTAAHTTSSAHIKLNHKKCSDQSVQGVTIVCSLQKATEVRHLSFHLRFDHTPFPPFCEHSPKIITFGNQLL